MGFSLRARPSHATVVAYLALFVALGGSSYAALRVGSKQIVNNSVRSKDIRDNNVASRDVRNGSLLARDFKAGQLPSGPVGARGADGKDGAQGPPGPTFAWTWNQLNPFPVEFGGANQALTATATTPAPGRILAIASLEAVTVDCSGGGNALRGLYVDGVPVPRTGDVAGDNVTQAYSAMGVTSTVLPAGQHTVAIGASCTGDNVALGITGTNEGILGGVLLGGQ